MLIDFHTHVEYKDKFDIQSVIDDMEYHNIDKRVISSLNNLTIHDNNNEINKLVKENNDKFIGCAVINPKLESSVNDTLKALELDAIKVFEFNSFEHAYYPDLEPNLDKILKLLNKKGMIVKVFTGLSAYGIPQQWEKYIEKYVEINFVFLHMGCFDYGYTCIDVVSRHNNAYVEISNQYELQILRKCLEEIDISKIIFGSTFPERLTSSSLKIFESFNLSEKDLNLIYYENANRLLGGQ